ncbi:GGDEF domain-containing protein [Pseudomarimonas salicorniae]|uniref:diguanylate cyclase n=1 Tax=Pseudomarimonas salicorniae TaxID=2933270 RepID=A0ABT0GKE9_9GAMM|nr:GGDEF domain-containing protein [Lysobacter sp. CAU 1642]MCK7595009.1 GGDEF domain-containing protein [Lysobacter sp. CAU 1642]
MRLDDISILALLAMIALINAGAILWVSRLAPQYPGPRQWSLALLCIAATAGLSISPLPPDSPWRGMLFNPALFAAQLFWLAGTLRFCGRPKRDVWLLAGFVAFVLLNTYLSLVEPNRELRIAISISASAAMKFWLVWVLYRYGRQHRNHAAWAVAISLVCEAMAYLFHAQLALTGQVPFFGGSTQFSTNIVWVAMVLGVTVTTPLYLLLALGRLVGDLDQAANRDMLTGLRNRRGFFASIEPLLAHARRNKGIAAVLMLDVDRFKRLNDRFGHAVGDAVLKVMGKTLQETLRGSDVAVRWGGEEFCAVLVNTDGAGAHSTAERVRRRFAEGCTGIEALRGGRVSVSIGIAYGALATHDFEVLQRKADEALYAAKQAGRDQVVAARLEDPPSPSPSPAAG